MKEIWLFIRIKLLMLIGVLAMVSCQSKSTKFGKEYNHIRQKYGSPIIHQYMELKSTSKDFEHWRTPESVIQTFEKGFHYGKGFYIHADSVLQEDDVFSNRVNDTTYNQVNILTYGKPKSVEFDCSFFKVDSRRVERSVEEYLNSKVKFPTYDKLDISIEQADSILMEWGVNIRRDKTI